MSFVKMKKAKTEIKPQRKMNHNCKGTTAEHGLLQDSWTYSKTHRRFESYQRNLPDISWDIPFLTRSAWNKKKTLALDWVNDYNLRIVLPPTDFNSTQISPLFAPSLLPSILMSSLKRQSNSSSYQEEWGEAGLWRPLLRWMLSSGAYNIAL